MSTNERTQLTPEQRRNLDKVHAVLMGKSYLPQPNQPLLTGGTDESEFYRTDELPFISGIANAYAEPGCTDPEPGAVIVCGNWNKDREELIEADFVDPNHRDTKPGERLTVGCALELLGCELEWADEWTTCCECGKLVRTSPDGYGWMQSYWSPEDSGYLLCVECVLSDPSGYIEYLTGRDTAAVTFDGIDLGEHGFERFNEDSFESGWHLGQTDDPWKIGTALRERGIDRYIFVVDDVGQFDMRFSVWVDSEQLANAIEREKEEQEAPPTEPDEGDYTTEDYSRFYQDGKLVVNVPRGEFWRDAIREHMDEQQFWPNVWCISDHGNPVLLSLDERED